MIYFCDVQVNSLPNQKLLYEKRYNIISDTFDKNPKFVRLFFKLNQKEFAYLFQKERENGHYCHYATKSSKSRRSKNSGNIFS